MSSWEAQNPRQCSLIWDDGKTISFSSPVKEVAKINLSNFTRLIFVPAMLDASIDMTSPRGALAEIIAMAAEAVMPEPERIAGLKRETQQKYNEILAAASPQLSEMESELNAVLRRYGGNSKINLNWVTQNVIDIGDSRPEVQLLADEYLTPVEHAGHGSQRALIMAMFQYRVQAKVRQEHPKLTGEHQSMLIAIEEPELYQHPLALHSIGQTFKEFTADSNSGDQLQVIYTTHSPLLVDPIDLESLRIVRKIPAEMSGPPQTEITSVNKAELMNRLYPEAVEQESAEGSLMTTLQTILTTDIKASLFSDTVVLVEGPKGKAAITAVASATDVDFQHGGTSVVSCNGKDNMPKIIAIFQSLRIPVYAIWDNDCDKTKMTKTLKLNESLVHLCSQDDNLPNPCEERVESTFACFNKELDDTLSADLGVDVYNKCLDKACNDLNLTPEKGKTNPEVIKQLCALAEQKNKRPKTLINIVQKITAMQGRLIQS